MEWFALIIPILTIIALRLFCERAMAWWEYSLPILVSVLIIGGGKLVAEKITIQSTEYHGGCLTKAVYFERWDEEVPCTHAKYRTETYSCGTSKSPSTCTRQVFDGYEHAYDVDDHPECWKISDSNGYVFNITENEFNRLSTLFKSRDFMEMNRNYHRIDGDAYVATWNRDHETLQPVTSTHRYENRVAHARGVYSYPTIDKTKTPVFDYPEIDNYTVSSILSQKVTQGPKIVRQQTYWAGSEDIDKVNAILGASKKIRIWILIWEGDVSRQVGLDQEAYWKGSNKNELVICINVRSHQDRTVNWCHVFSWSKSEYLKSSISSYLSVDHPQLDLKEFATFLEPQVKENWVKRNWHDFDFISVEPPTWAMWTIWILTVLSTGGVAVYCVRNEFGDKSETV